MKLGDNIKIDRTVFSKKKVISVEKYGKIDSIKIFLPIGLSDFPNIGDINEANDTLSNWGGSVIWKYLDFEFWMMSYQSFGSFSLLVCLFVCLCICLFVRLLACLFVCLFICSSVYLFVSSFVCVCLCVHLFICLFVC